MLLTVPTVVRDIYSMPQTNDIMMEKKTRVFIDSPFWLETSKSAARLPARVPTTEDAARSWPILQNKSGYWCTYKEWKTSLSCSPVIEGSCVKIGEGEGANTILQLFQK